MTLECTRVALICEIDGTISAVLNADDPHLAERAVGSSLLSLFDAGSVPKAHAFLDDLRSGRPALFWELNVRSLDGTNALLFSGQRDREGLLVIATRRHGDLFVLCDSVCASAPSAVGGLLAAVEVQSATLGARMESEVNLLEELSRLNNELANLQRELARKNAELQRMERMKNQLLGMAAHDLRSPLGLIRTYADFLLTDPAAAPSDQQRQLLGTIRSSSEFMMELVNDLLDVAAIEAGGLTLSPEPVDIDGLVRAHVEVQRVLAAPKGVEIRLASEPSLQGTLDPRRFEQVLSNLIGNAVKFSTSGSVVDVAVRRDGEYVALTVADRGVGIPAERLSRIFEPFGRSGTRGTAGERGTGLGLAIVRRIVADHGGTINVHSEVGVGTRFELRIALGGA